MVRFQAGLARSHGRRGHPARILDARATAPVAAETLCPFARPLGRFAGDLTIVSGRSGGVLFAGGSAPRVVDA